MQLSGIDVNLVIALRALLVHRSVTRAGQDVGLSQSSMSHALARLRAHFDDPLLVRVGRDHMLTERAKGLVEPVVDAVARLECVFGRSKPFDSQSSRRVFRLAAADNLGLYALPQLAAICEKTAPGIELRVHALLGDWMVSLERGDVDLVLGRKQPVPKTLETQDLAHEPFACVVRHGHSAAARLTAQEYAALDHLVIAPTDAPTPESSDPMDTLLARHGLHRRVKMTVPHFLVAPFVVATSNLALAAPERLLDPFVRALRLRRLDLPLRLAGYDLSQVWAARFREDEGHQWLRATISGLFVPPT
jgi:DNA-binding transcriptional LysR family regulator